MSTKTTQAKELERIHVSEYLDLVDTGEQILAVDSTTGERTPKAKLYTLVASKMFTILNIGNDGGVSVFDIRKGSKGGKVNGPHNLSILPGLKNNPVWIEDGSFVLEDAVVSKGIICGHSIIKSNAKINCEGFVKGVSVGHNISLSCKHNIKTPYDLWNSYTDTVVNLTDEGDILYIDGLKILNKFDSGITIFNPADSNDREVLIMSQILDYLYRDKTNKTLNSDLWDTNLQAMDNWHNIVSRNFYNDKFDDYRNKVIDAVYGLAQTYFDLPN